MGQNTRFAAVIPHRAAFAGVLIAGSGVTEIRVLTTIALPRVYTTAQPVHPGARFFAECDARGLPRAGAARVLAVRGWIAGC